ncbi:MAG: DUF192 domain-containing protein [Actinomycetota bacterium]
MPWLVHEGRVLSSLEIAETRRDRRTGLLGRDGIDGALLLRPARSVHTVKMRFAIDVAHVDDDLVVLSTTTMVPGRVGRWSPRAGGVIEAEAGSFRRWGLTTGMQLEIRE